MALPEEDERPGAASVAARGSDLLRTLGDGRFHSGEAVAREMAISRAAVWKLVQSLRRRGYGVDAVRGRGYRLRDAGALLEASTIASEVVRVTGIAAAVQVLDSTGSTSTALRDRRHGTPPRVLFAENQTAGRGRLGRTWLSPRGGLYFSVDWQYSDLPGGPSGLSLAVGVRVAETLAILGAGEIGVKWPNDLLWRGAKLGGILVELVGEPAGRCRVIVGVGLNWRPDPDGRRQLEQPVAALSDVLGAALPARCQVAAMVAAAVVDACRLFPSAREELLGARWQRFDLLSGRDVVLDVSGRRVEGRMAGIDSTGALLLATRNGTERFLSGDTRLRIAE